MPEHGTMASATASLDEAIAHGRRLLASAPKLAETQAREILATVGPQAHAEMLLALSLRAQDRIHEALIVLRALCRREPAYPQVWREIGDLLTAVGDLDGAESAYAAHARFAARDPRLLAAGSALHANDLPKAEALLRQHLAVAPSDVAALRMLAELAARLGRQEDAIRLLEHCLSLAPDFHAARQNYAMVLHRSNRPEQAMEQIDLLLTAQPADANTRNLKAVVLCRTGDYAPAIRIYEALVAQFPAQPRLWLSLGHALKTHGDTTRAIAAYRQALDLEPGSGETWWSLANLKTLRFDDEDIVAMQAQLAREDLSDDERLQLQFALGKALEDHGDHAASFAYYAAGNALRRAALRYSADETSLRVSRIEARYTRDFFAERAGCGTPAKDPIFIVGLPRAGSTLIEQILSSHPSVEGTMELPEIISITRELRKIGPDGRPLPYHEVLANLPPSELQELGERYLARTRIHRKTDAPFFIDKMPNNMLHVGLIHLILPNARIIDARRHPLACCFSGFKQHFARGQSFSYSLEDIGRYYHDYVRLMAHFDAVLPGRILRVHYESMVEDTETEVRRLLEHCGLPFDAACLRFFENRRPVRTASSEQVRQPIYRDGVDHWRHFEPWLDPLKQALGPVLEAYPNVPPFQPSLRPPTNP